MKIKVLIILLILSVRLYSQFIFLGPMAHYNFGTGKGHFSYGLEASCWVLPIAGFDAGFEYEKDKFRIYSEGQYGFIGGVAAGYVREFYKDGTSSGGFQGSVWGAFFGGLDFRVRDINGDKYYAPGIFAKYPLYHPPDPLLDGNGF
jgi:hypothetical protein